MVLLRICGSEGLVDASGCSDPDSVIGVCGELEEHLIELEWDLAVDFISFAFFFIIGSRGSNAGN